MSFFDTDAYFQEKSPRWLAASKQHTGRGKPKMTAAEMKKVAYWWNTTPWVPGNSIPGFTPENIERYYDEANLRDLYEKMFGRKPHAKWGKRELAAKLLVLNAAIEDADARKQEALRGS